MSDRPLTDRQKSALAVMAQDPQCGWELIGMRTLDGLVARGLATNRPGGEQIRGAVLTDAGLAMARSLARERAR